MRRFRTLSIPQHAHPLVRRLFQEMNYQRIGMTDMAERVGMSRFTINGWKTSHCPRIVELEACYNVLGYKLTLLVLKDD